MENEGVIYFGNFKASKARKTALKINGNSYSLWDSEYANTKWVGRKTYKMELPYGTYEIKYSYVYDMGGTDMSDTTKPITVSLTPAKPVAWVIKKLGFTEPYLKEVSEFKLK